MRFIIVFVVVSYFGPQTLLSAELLFKEHLVANDFDGAVSVHVAGVQNDGGIDRSNAASDDDLDTRVRMRRNDRGNQGEHTARLTSAPMLRDPFKRRFAPYWPGF